MIKRIQFLFLAWISAVGHFVEQRISAAEFVNLNFESANLPVIPAGEFGGLTSIEAALPGWQANTPFGQIAHNNYALGSSSISIFGPDWQGRSILEGGFTLLLQAGADPDTGAPRDVSIAQSGLVPLLAQSIHLKASPLLPSTPIGPFLVTLDGNAVPMIPLAQDQNYTLFGGAVDGFAGDTVELRITASSTISSSGRYNQLLLDSITFSPVPIPEPSTWALLSIGSLCFVAAQIRKRARR